MTSATTSWVWWLIPTSMPELLRALELVVRAGVADHERAGELGELHRRRADAAADGVDQHRLARLELRAGEEHVPGGAERDLGRGRVLVGESVRDAHELAGAAGELLGVRRPSVVKLTKPGARHSDSRPVRQ